MSVRLDGEVVLISGASSGLGRGTARILAERGARIASISRRAGAATVVGAEIERAGGEFLHVAGDVTKTADCDAAVSATIECYGRIDVLINNAANPSPLRKVDALEDESWAGVIGPTLDGVMRLSRAAIALLCSDDACEINGAVIAMDKGISAGLLTSTALYLGAAQILPG